MQNVCRLMLFACPCVCNCYCLLFYIPIYFSLLNLSINGTVHCMHIDCFGVFHLAVLADFSARVIYYYIHFYSWPMSLLSNKWLIDRSYEMPHISMHFQCLHQIWKNNILQGLHLHIYCYEVYFWCVIIMQPWIDIRIYLILWDNIQLKTPFLLLQ